ncbi:ATP-dependent RNA helicase DHX8 [Hondaea fermentalgiana]|uniref:RNA helicase n=1 Tax=Hondaea fermentalgiana TaxID=2315210 RepID=A0A2R5GTK9_9STRA|nr:ATP-dependent RNA helicase DHX8 [Hondaea fermentalgiana]|eukprot:GBG33659.1 ATP-dependent RNA helicase DHX8 [Hondaea fermentalgiana]
MARTREDNLNEDHHLVKDKNSKVSPGGDADTTDALADRDKRTKAKTKKQAKGKKRLREETSDDLRAKEAKRLKKEHKRIKMQKKFVKLAKYMAAKGYINDDVVSNLTRNIRKSRDRNATSKQVGKETLNAPPTLRVAKAKARDDDAKAKDRDDSPAASNDRDIQSEVQQASGPTSPISRSSGQRQARSQIDVAGNGNPPDAAATLSADRWDSSPRRRVLARACAPTFLGEKTFDVTEDEEAEVVPISRHRKQSARPGAMLPVAQAYDLLLEMCAKHATVVVVGETGSGKSTQIPQFLMEQRTFGGRVAVTQPRRVAAISLAQRVCWERKCKLGTLVGHCVRFDDRTSRKTRLRFLTDGMLLREAMLDPQLLKYSVIILDEAHERSLGTDILFGIVRRAQRARRQGRMPLRVVVMSATLDVRTFLDFFKPDEGEPEDPFHRPVAVHIQGRQYGVQVLYAEDGQKDYLDAAVVAAIQAHLEEDLPGDILIFLTGQEEIEACAELLEERARRLPAETAKLLVCPIFAALPAHEQMRVFEPAPEGTRKVVLATNIAETSITIPGVRIVIDTGMVKAKAYSATSGLELLQVVPTSQEQAWQRTGRAGREGPGKCFRLYPESAFFKLRPRTVPEIKRVELSQVVLQLLVLGVTDLQQFDFVDAPPRAALTQALFNLVALGAVRIPSRHEAAAAVAATATTAGSVSADAEAAALKKAQLPHLTDLGRRMASLPLEPMHAKFLLDASRFECLDHALSVAAMCSVESPFYTPRSARRDAIEAHARFASFEADHLTLLNVFNGFREAKTSKDWCKASFLKFGTLIKAKRVRDQLVAMLDKDSARKDSPSPPTKQEKTDDMTEDASEKLLRCLVSGFPLRIAQRLPPDGSVPGTRYRTFAEGIEARIHPSSSLARRDPMPEWVVYNELVLTSKKYLKMVAAVDQAWLMECAPHLFKPTANPNLSSASPGVSRDTSAKHDRRKSRSKRDGDASDSKESRLAKRRALLMCD